MATSASPHRSGSRTVKGILRRIVVRTSVPPFDAVYLWAYRTIERLAGSVLGRCRGVRAVYLTRGCAKAEITPGISDIDLIVITDDEAACRSVGIAGRRLRQATAGLVDTYPNFVATRSRFEHRWRTAPAWQYRIQEGRASWKLLFGHDVLPALEPLPPGKLSRACYLELCRWWMVFAKMLDLGYHERDIVLRNVTCFKCVSEVLYVDHVRRTGEFQRSRSDALEGHDSPLASRLRALRLGRFLSDDPDVVNDTCGFLCRFFTDLWADFGRRPFLEVFPGITQQVDAAVRPDADLARHVQSLQDLVHRDWGAKSSTVHALRSVSFDAEQWLVLVDGTRDALPTAQQLASLLREHRRRWGTTLPRVCLVLRIGPLGFPLTVSIPGDLHRGLLTPATTPDVFLQLGEKLVYWTDFTDWHLCQWQTNEQWLEASDFKRRQLQSVAAGARAGKIVYPLAPAALEEERPRVTRPEIAGDGGTKGDS